MSTYYHDLNEPWSHVEMTRGGDAGSSDDECGLGPSECRVTVWDDRGSRCGSLTVHVDDAADAIRSFFSADAEPVCQTYASRNGVALRRFRPARTTVLMNEYGELTMLEKLQSKCAQHYDSVPATVSASPEVRSLRPTAASVT